MQNGPVVNKLSWMIGGPQGSGVDSSAMLFSRACNFGGLYVYGYREYYSNIMGEHSYFIVRVEDKPVLSQWSHTDLLATFEGETIAKHALDVGRDGGIIYDATIGKTKLEQIHTLEERVRTDLENYLHRKGLGDTLEDLLEDARRRGVHLYPIPYNDLIRKVAEKLGETQMSKLARVVNTMAVAASFSILDYPLRQLLGSVETTFRGKAPAIKSNSLAAQEVYDYVAQKYKGSLNLKLGTVSVGDQRLFLAGFNAVALGKLAAGCRFQSYYPISPATDESTFLEDHEVFNVFRDNGKGEKTSKAGIVVVQTEDEIASITMACGAALTGVRASTATSGPGFSLMAEGIGWAGMNEVPVVLTVYQRGGPSTGLPTRSEQGDLRFALHMGHGEFPKIVLASGDVEECFYDAMRAFNYADRYQTPVLHLVEKSIAQNTRTIKPFDVNRETIDRGLLLSEKDVTGRNGDNEYKRFEFTDSGVSPRTVLGTKDGVFHNTGDEHDEYGHISEDPVVRKKIMEKRMNKLELADSEIPDSDKVNFFGNPDAENIVVSWGSPKGAILEALHMFKEEGVDLGFLQIRLMSPFPIKIVTDRLSKAKRIINVENNYTGQLAGLIREKTGVTAGHLILKYTGRPMTTDEVYGAVKQILSQNTKKLVLTHGA